MKTILLVLIMFFVLSCSKNEYSINNMFGDSIIVLGHGGMGSGQSYPMDTYESILKCINAGTDGSEIDVQLTKDNVLVAYHGMDLSEKTNIKGVIGSLTWDSMKDGYYTTTPYLGYSILRLDVLFSNIKDLHNYKFTFDCKLYLNSPVYKDNFITSIIELLNKYDISENVYIESTDIDFLNKIQEERSDLKLFIYPQTFEEGLRLAIDNRLYGITISTRDISKSQIEIAHENNLHVAIWNTHTRKDNTEAVEKNPDFIQTDKVEYLVKILN